MTAVALDIRPGTSTTYPAGPPFLPRLLTGRMFRQNATDSMTDYALRYGDLVHIQVFNRHIFQLNHPDLIEDFLIRDVSQASSRYRHEAR